MSNLIPHIEIGKRYLLTPRSTEGSCPVCGTNFHFGKSWEAPCECSILRYINPGEKIRCNACKECFPLDSDGYWEVFELVHGIGMVPYTLLSRLPDEQYEEEE